jgi:hypothetical protein
MSKAADTGAQSMRYGDSAAVITVAWLVIDKYRNAKVQPAITSATKPIAVWGTLRIFDNIVQYPSSALVGKARRAGRSCSAHGADCINGVKRRGPWFKVGVRPGSGLGRIRQCPRHSERHDLAEPGETPQWSSTGSNDRTIG